MRTQIQNAKIQTILARFIVIALGILPCIGSIQIEAESLDPTVYRNIEINSPQLFVDDYLVENRFNEDRLSAPVPHALQMPERLPEPLLTMDADKPWESTGLGYPSVIYDPYEKKFRLYYQVSNAPTEEQKKQGRGSYSSCYAESEDGIHWQKPLMDITPWGDIKKTNVVLYGEHEGKAPNVFISPEDTNTESRIRNIGNLPKEAFKGHRFLMYYCDSGHYLATSEDGLHWNEHAQKIMNRRVDCHHTIVYNKERNEYVSLLRNKIIFGDSKENLAGNTRMISRIASPILWSLWDTMPSATIIPDGDDYERFYGMPTFEYGGVYFGMLQQFKENPQIIEVELMISRDTLHWEHLPGRPKIIPVGQPGTWDDGMTFSADRIIEVDNKWRLYYTGHDGYHNEKGRVGAVGMLTFGKERLVSITSDREGKESYVVTRPMIWPGGDLLVNADASKGYMKFRITDLYRKPYTGFEYTDSEPLNKDSIRHKVTWKSADMKDLKGKTVRLEFIMKNADLFAFVAQE